MTDLDTDYVMEPFRIKMVEQIQKTTRRQRRTILKKAKYNLFKIPSKYVSIDLLTDSGTGAMSDRQWSGMMIGDEAYAGAKSFYKLESTVQKIFKYQYVIPCHQGRAAENLLFPVLLEEKSKQLTSQPIYISNYHFDTTAAHVELNGGKPINCVSSTSKDINNYHPFKGNMDVNRMKEFIDEHGKENIVAIIITITCNSVGGQPVSLQNMKDTWMLSKSYDIPVIIDAARFAENAFFIKDREPAFRNWSLKKIVQKMFSYGDAFVMSCKKDALVNIGGLCCVKKNKNLYEKTASRCVPYEGYITYGGLAGRDIEAISIGLEEGIQEEYLQYRIGQIQYLGAELQRHNVPIQYPPGGHAIFIDAKQILPHVEPKDFPAQALAIALYEEAGIRSVEIGSFLLGNDPITNQQKPSEFEFLRLTIPRRVYTKAHFDVIVNAFKNLKMKAHFIGGVSIIKEPKILRHFTAELALKKKESFMTELWKKLEIILDEFFYKKK